MHQKMKEKVGYKTCSTRECISGLKKEQSEWKRTSTTEMEWIHEKNTLMLT